MTAQFVTHIFPGRQGLRCLFALGYSLLGLPLCLQGKRVEVKTSGLRPGKGMDQRETPVASETDSQKQTQCPRPVEWILLWLAKRYWSLTCSLSKSKIQAEW